jgi:hypothetical protein
MTQPVPTIGAAVLAMFLSAGPAMAQSKPLPQQDGRRPNAESAQVQQGSQSTSVPVPSQAADETREQLERVLEQYPPSLPRVLRLDPTLLTDTTYLQPYPALAAFLTQHPEVAHNPSFFFSRYQNDNFYRSDPQQRALELWRSTIEGFTITAVMVAVAGALAWLIKTLIDHRRWTRLSRVQTDVHNKLLDRFTSNEDLLAYIQTPAGRRFLESAPIPTESPRSIGAPLGRILWSAQAGAVLTVAGLGLQVVSARSIDEVAQPLSAVGIVVLAIGIGFGLSALLAYILSRRLGLVASASETAPETRG